MFTKLGVNLKLSSSIRLKHYTTRTELGVNEIQINSEI